MTGCNLEVLGHRVLVKPEPIEEVSESGIVIVINEKQKRMEKAGAKVGTVVQVGNTAWSGEENWIVVGDEIVFSKYGGKPISDPVTEEEYLIMNDEDVLCKLHREGRK
jgi:chaperonin GroES